MRPHYDLMQIFVLIRQLTRRAANSADYQTKVHFHSKRRYARFAALPVRYRIAHQRTGRQALGANAVHRCGLRDRCKAEDHGRAKQL